MKDIRVLVDANRSGERVGLPCFCTANGHVLRTVLDHARESGFPTVIEATCNQVNQEGGYTGMKPVDFMAWIRELATTARVDMNQLIVGGDHLGPNPWRNEPAETAMAKARHLVRLYAEAGFRKIHIDSSMALGGEAHPSFVTIAERAADLCTVAETYAPERDQLVYIIGTEVPIPGGETEEPDALDVTSVARLAETIDTHRTAFESRGLGSAWERVVSVVTQPGVDFGHSSVWPFEPMAAMPLAEAILGQPGLTFEAHSTDYQPAGALGDLVANHFFFLKVGPELTFRFREAVFALAAIEDEMAVPSPSNLRQTIARRMEEGPDHWRGYYRGTPAQIVRLRNFSYSDRIRYYWPDPMVADALGRLIANLRETPPPESLTSQHFGGLEFGDIPSDPEALIRQHVARCVRRYFSAAGFRPG